MENEEMHNLVLNNEDEVDDKFSIEVANDGSETTSTAHDEYSPIPDCKLVLKRLSAEDIWRSIPYKIGKYKYKCCLCHFKSTSSTKVVIHLRSHTGEKPYACGDCGWRTATSSSFGRHKSKPCTSYTGKRETAKIYNCNVCDFQTPYRCSVQRHMTVHTGEKPFGCDKCSYRTNVKYSLIAHLQTHRDGKSYACDVCPFVCRHLSTLRKHVRKHSKSCDLPPSEYLDSLLESMENEEDEESVGSCEEPISCSPNMETSLVAPRAKLTFECDICGYVADNNDEAKTHMKSHWGGKRFSCDFCEYKAGYSSALAIHMRSHTIDGIPLIHY
ncbi:hypothetical protein GE061_019952 [Apolygus lucorum]|uniref:C2H2-type domain-containing protein n=1 Tax=Apolygus lucorum TaxID=248454 RepID=A0A6A4JR01_APOLU|nr:hypothetical protein GE061_019952 [Apolygus lucorum]